MTTEPPQNGHGVMTRAMNFTSGTLSPRQASAMLRRAGSRLTWEVLWGSKTGITSGYRPTDHTSLTLQATSSLTRPRTHDSKESR